MLTTASVDKSLLIPKVSSTDNFYYRHDLLATAMVVLRHSLQVE